MSGAGRQALVGAFVLGGIALGLAAIVLFGKFDLFHPSVRAAIVFKDSIAGLSVGAPVTFRGVRIGAVEQIGIEFDPKTYVAFIPVTVALMPGQALVVQPTNGGGLDLADMVKRGLRAELNVQSFVTGQSQIDLDFDLGSPAVLHPDITSLPEIPARQSTLERAKEQLSQLPLRELTDDTMATLKSLRELTEKLNEDLPPLIESLKATSERTGQTVDTAGQAIQALQVRLDGVLGAIGQVAATGDREVRQRGEELHVLLADSDRTMREVRDLMSSLQGLTSERGAARANIEATLRDLAAASASLRGFANDVEHDPQLLLTGRGR